MEYRRDSQGREPGFITGRQGQEVISALVEELGKNGQGKASQTDFTMSGLLPTGNQHQEITLEWRARSRSL